MLAVLLLPDYQFINAKFLKVFCKERETGDAGRCCQDQLHVSQLLRSDKEFLCTNYLEDRKNCIIRKTSVSLYSTACLNNISRSDKYKTRKVGNECSSSVKCLFVSIFVYPVFCQNGNLWTEFENP